MSVRAPVSELRYGERIGNIIRKYLRSTHHTRRNISVPSPEPEDPPAVPVRDSAGGGALLLIAVYNPPPLTIHHTEKIALRPYLKA